LFFDVIVTFIFVDCIVLLLYHIKFYSSFQLALNRTCVSSASVSQSVNSTSQSINQSVNQSTI